MALRSAFLNDLLSRVPAEHRPGVEAALAADEVQDFADHGARRQQDYSRAMDTVRTQTQQLETERAAVNARAQEQLEWFNANTAVLEAGRRVLDGGTPNPNPNPTPVPVPQVPADVLRRADVESLINQREQGAVAFFSVLNQLSLEHYKRFGEVLDTNALTNDPDAGKIGIAQVYQKQHAEKIAAAATAAEDTRINGIVQTRLAEERRKFGSQPPYPVAGSEVSPLDVLTQPAGDASRFSTEAAADEYARLVSLRAAG